jgi:hypothetical protein
MSPGYKSILQQPDRLAFDENIYRIPTAEERIFRIQYPLRYLFNLPNASSLRLQELRYQYQWFIKHHECYRKKPVDMTDIIFQQVRKKQITASFNDLLCSDRSFNRRGKKSWELQWIQGALKDLSNNREIFSFHFVDSKSRHDFHITPAQPFPDSFTLTEKGIHS